MGKNARSLYRNPLEKLLCVEYNQRCHQKKRRWRDRHQIREDARARLTTLHEKPLGSRSPFLDG